MAATDVPHITSPSWPSPGMSGQRHDVKLLTCAQTKK